MQKDFQKTLAEKLFSSLLNRHGLGGAHHHHHHNHRHHHSHEKSDPTILNSVSQRWNREELEAKKKNLDFKGVTVLDLGKVLYHF